QQECHAEERSKSPRRPIRRILSQREGDAQERDDKQWPEKKKARIGSKPQSKKEPELGRDRRLYWGVPEVGRVVSHTRSEQIEGNRHEDRHRDADRHGLKARTLRGPESSRTRHC